MSDRDYHCWATATTVLAVAAILLAWLGLCGAAAARPPQVLPAPQSLPAPARADGEPHPDGGGWRWSAAWGCWYRLRPAPEVAAAAPFAPWSATTGTTAPAAGGPSSWSPAAGRYPARTFTPAPVVLPRGGTNCPT